MTDQPREYQSYLLRVWRTTQGETGGWRAALEDIRTGQWHGFASLSAAFTFLDLQTGTEEGASDQLHLSLTDKPDE